MVPIASMKGWRDVPVDGGRLFFHRDTGANMLCEGDELAHCRQRAPRAIQFAITNVCNLACSFCSRDVEAVSAWRADDVVALLGELSNAGVLEVAFGGGEPFAFAGFTDVVRRLYDETQLAVSFTTNATLLTEEKLARIDGRYGQIRVSLYDDNDWRARVRMLANARARFGVNQLVTPANADDIEARVIELASLGCSDVLLLCYKGRDAALHLSLDASRALAARVAVLARALRGRVALKLDICWGERMQAVPRFSQEGRVVGDGVNDCGAGRDFLVVTSDKRVMPCSFHHTSVPFTDAADLLRIWRERRADLAAAARAMGCARAPGFGLPSSVATSSRLRVLSSPGGGP